MKRIVKLLGALVIAFSVCVPIIAAGPYYSGALLQEDATKAAADLYKAWYDAVVTAKDTLKGVELAQSYVTKYPAGERVSYLKSWLAGPMVRWVLFSQAQLKKNVPEMIRLTKEAAADDKTKDYPDYPYWVVLSIRDNELLASPPVTTHLPDLIEFAKRAIQLIDAGKLPTTGPKDLKKEAALSGMYFSIAQSEKNLKHLDQAIEYQKKVVALDPTNPAVYLFLGIYYNDQYKDLSDKYSKILPTDTEKPESKALLDSALLSCDNVIEAWVPFLALTVKDNKFPNRSDIEKVVAQLYIYRHPDKGAAGLQQVINEWKPGQPVIKPVATAPPTTVGTTPAAVTPAATTPKPK